MVRRPVAKVLPDSRVPQLDREFEYTVPESMHLEPGMVVRVPIGKGGRLTTGWVSEVGSTQQYPGELADVESVVSQVPLITPSLWELARAVAQRGAGGVADVLRLAVPKRAVRAEKAWVESRDQHDSSLVESPRPSGTYDEGELGKALHPGARTSVRLPYGVVDISGNTIPRGHREVALWAVHMLSQGHSSVICLPDWRDLLLFEQAISDLVNPAQRCVFDSEDTLSSRYSSFLRCLEQRPVIAYGLRHVVYAPVSRLGLLVVLDDADSSFQEPLAPYPHTRDVAVLRAEGSGAALILASFLPSVECARFIQLGFFDEVAPRMITRPRVIPTALTTRAQEGPGPARLPSLAHRALAEAITLGPVLVQVFRSGFAPGSVCGDCGMRAECQQCGGPLTTPEKARGMRCGWCRHLVAMWRCPHCSSTALRPLGQAVGRTVAELGKAFPGVPVVRADGEHRLERVADRPCLVVATRGAEPVAQRGYRACLLLDGDSMLQRPSLGALPETLRAWEAALSLLAHDAIAYLTDLTGPVASAFASGASDQLVARELQHRSGLRLPPSVRLASLEGPTPVVSELAQSLEKRFLGVSAVGSVQTPEANTRLVLRVPYHVGQEVAAELRAAVVQHASARRRGSGTLRVAMDDHRALDELAGVAQ